MRRGLASSREQAQAAVLDGQVLVGGAPAVKPSRLVAPAEPVVVLGAPPRYVSRGGEKLAAALDGFGLDVARRRALDAGASTGGFTDCLLQRGADHVTAVDVGHGQLHERLRGDSRVTALERTDIRRVVLDRPADVVVADLSFISLTSVAEPLLRTNAAPGADVVVLVKPQFEAGRHEASRGRGVIRDPSIWLRVLEETRTALEGHGAAMMGAMVSPLTGAAGNVEFLAHLRAHTAPQHTPAVDLAALVGSIVAGAGAAGTDRS